MNGQELLAMLLDDAEKNAVEFYDSFSYNLNRNIEDKFHELNSRRPIKNMPTDFYDKINLSRNTNIAETEHISYLRELFKENITFISLALNYIYPYKYLFYRVSALENEIFAGLKFFSDVIEDFNLPFSKIGEGKDSFDNYLRLNKSLLLFANGIWPEIKDPKIIQQRVHYFIYEGLGNLFLTKNNYKQYWIMATGKTHFNALDNEPEVNWSSRKEMHNGDLVFMYRQTPRKAITDLYEAQDPWFDPYGGWTGFWVPLRKITSIKDVSMVEMKHDEILKHWSFVKASSQGVSTAPMPYFAYNRLLELIDSALREKFNLKPEITELPLDPNNIIEYKSEKEFEDKVIEPLIRSWGFKYQRQSLCDFAIGSQHHTCEVDFLVRDSNNEDITLFENKIRIANEKELSVAMLQAKSYALQLGMGTFVVAAPEGFWIYMLDRNKERLAAKISSDKVREMSEISPNKIKEIEDMKSLILKSRA